MNLIVRACTVLAQTSFKFMSWGTWLLLLWFYPIQFFPPVLGLFNSIICLIPSVICFLIAANWMLREMRAQRDSEFTDAV